MYTVVILLVIAVSFAIVFSICCAILLFKKSICRPKRFWPIIETKGPRVPFGKKMQESADWFLSKNPDEVHIKSFDGYDLYARFLKAPQCLDDTGDAKGTIIMMHGYHSTALRDFACIYEYFHNEGYNVLLPDQRAHGNSGSKYLTFGIKERYDCRDWISWILEKNKQGAVWLMGISMGCATVTYTAGFDLPPQVKGIIADCGYTKPYDMMKLTINEDYHLPSVLILFFANIISRLIAKFGLSEYSTKKALENNTVPILFIHGVKDTFVPYAMSKINYELCKAPKDMLSTQAVHAMSFMSEPELYKESVKAFMKKHA